MQLNFQASTTARRVLFAPGASASLPDEVSALCKRPLVITTARGSEQGAALTEGMSVAGYFAEATVHVPSEVVDRAVSVASQTEADAYLAIGGGSTIGLAKAVALRDARPILCVPTTFSGSEMTNIWGVQKGTTKTTGRNDRVRPALVVYDPDLLRTLPRPVATTSGVNAIAHAIEAHYAHDTHPLLQLTATEAIRSLAHALPALSEGDEPNDALARALYGAYLAGLCLDGASMGLHHKLCHLLGGRFSLPHSALHAVILPHAVAYNAEAAPRTMDAIRDALGKEPAEGLLALNHTLGIRDSLASLGIPEDSLDDLAAAAIAQPYPNPRPLELAGVRTLLRNAWANPS
ncbi:MAG: maleylacetate reductase [Myxococcota bacterium]